MPTITRKQSETVFIDLSRLSDEEFAAAREEGVHITVVDARSGKARLNVQAPACVGIHRLEAWEEQRRQGAERDARALLAAVMVLGGVK